ncbi:dTMP kinase, partial [Rickettsiaceae bacterium]|nr:dTMP kinase [Rickettsiaceae bacterium]
MSFNRPKFITFEGGEGSGKSTQSKMLHQYLLSKNIKAIHTREVGGTVEAEKIRDLLVYSELLSMSELMLVMAARYEHINKVIIPALLEGSWVICDRFVDSTACYQSGDSGLSMDDIYELHA